MNKINIFLIVVIVFLLVAPAFAQPTNNFVGDAVLPAPNAAALGKYGDIPVSNYTGVPGVGVPIYTLQEGPLSLPVTLSYHASGIKVGELASWIGLGWSLQAGGLITRTILGLPDNDAFGYYDSGIDLTLDDEMIRKAGIGEIDAQPDLFTFNFNGYTGKFYLDANGAPFLMPQQDLVIEIGDFTHDFTHFIITTPDGTKYYFGDLPGNPLSLALKKAPALLTGITMEHQCPLPGT